MMDRVTPIDSGFVFGTNRYLDRAKGTFFSLPQHVTKARLESIKVWFTYKHTALWTDQYNLHYTVEVYNGAPEEGPLGSPLFSQRHALIDVQADNDFNTASIATNHALQQAVEVGSTFFVAIDFEAYGTDAVDRIAIGASDRVDKRVAQVWEKQADGKWNNVSDAWFGQGGQPGDQGWHLWMEATVAVETPYEGTPCMQGDELAARDLENYDRFGRSVAVSGNYAIVGNTGTSIGSSITQVGSVRLFAYDGTTWVQQAQISPADQTWGEGVGSAVAISGDYAAVGAYNKGYNDVNDAAGAVYIFKRNGSTWTEKDAFATGPGDNFGYAVAMSENMLIIGAPGTDRGALSDAGAAYVLTLAGETSASWTETELVPADPATGAAFGSAVHISGNVAIVGAPNSDIGGDENVGAAYVFVRTGSVWSQVARLIAGDPKAEAWFGKSVSISDDYAVVGAPGVDAAYVFVRNGSNWTQVARLTASDADTPWGGSLFGQAVATNGGRIVVGAPGAKLAYLYGLDGASWTEQAKLVTDVGVASFGEVVALSSNYAFVADPDYDVTAFRPDVGAVFVYKLSGSPVAIEDQLNPEQQPLLLDAPYPNPFTHTTTIAYHLSAVSDVVLTVYDMLGREVRTLVKQRQAAGSYKVEFDAADLPSGVYLCKLAVANGIQVRRVVLIR